MSHILKAKVIVGGDSNVRIDARADHTYFVHNNQSSKKVLTTFCWSDDQLQSVLTWKAASVWASSKLTVCLVSSNNMEIHCYSDM